MMRFLWEIFWKLQDQADAILDKLSRETRWNFIEFLMAHKVLTPCRADAYFWSIGPGEQSIFELSDCDYCAGSKWCYCGKERP